MIRRALAAATLGFAWLAGAPAGAQQTTYTLSPTADAYIRGGGQAGNNFGTANILSVEPASRQSLLQFDISSVPAAHVLLSARLRLYVNTAAASHTANVHRTTAAWTETGATWTNMNTNYSATVEASAAPSTASVYIEFDVLSLVRAWRAGTANYGFMVLASGINEARFNSREATSASTRPELVIVATAQPSYSVSKLSTVVSDPANGTTQPKRMPGAVVEYSVTVSSTNSNVSDNNSIAMVEAVPAQATLYVGDLGGGGSGPVSFTNGSPSSGLTYTYSGLASGTDDLSFSSNGGSSWAYVPVPDADGYDLAVTHIRIAPKGVFAGSTGSGDPSFSYQFRAKNK